MTSPALFDPVKLGSLQLKNRIFMASMTRARAPERVPTDSMIEYYTRRAGAGLIVAESTAVSPQGIGSVSTPGIYTDEQIAGWRQVTDSVHRAGGKIMCQLWHAGRVSHSSVQENNQSPVSASAVRGEVTTFTQDGFVSTTTPRALTLEEVPELIETYVQAAHNAIAAGFDGVEVHAGNGYLLEQFLRDGTNKRTDKYGGSIVNRSRLVLEVVDAVIDAVGAERTAVRITPMVLTWDCVDSDPVALFSYLVVELEKRNLAFLELVERMIKSFATEDAVGAEELEKGVAEIRSAYHGNYVANGGLEPADAHEAMATGYADAVSFARDYISNSDLAERLEKEVELNQRAEQVDFYGNPEDYDKGYLDWPTMLEG